VGFLVCFVHFYAESCFHLCVLQMFFFCDFSHFSSVVCKGGQFFFWVQRIIVYALFSLDLGIFYFDGVILVVL
jgi:hypothetical protein